MLSFREWLLAVEGRAGLPPGVLHGCGHVPEGRLPQAVGRTRNSDPRADLIGLAREGDEGYQAFIDGTNAEFRAWIDAILRMGKFTDPRNETEARAIAADPGCFDYAQELVAAAGGGRARLRGQDVLDGAQEANVQLWRVLLDPKLYEPEGVTWETRNPPLRGAERHTRHDPLLGTQRGRPVRLPHQQASGRGGHPPLQSNPRPRRPVRPAGPPPGERTGMGRPQAGHHRRPGSGVAEGDRGPGGRTGGPGRGTSAGQRRW